MLPECGLEGYGEVLSECTSLEKPPITCVCVGCHKAAEVQCVCAAAALQSLQLSLLFCLVGAHEFAQ